MRTHFHIGLPAALGLIGWATVGVGPEVVATAAVLAPSSVPAVAQEGALENPRLVLLGIDGMDPDILAGVIERHPETTQNLQWLVSKSGIHALDTSNPPQSPVAWSNFITGRDPGGHGVYDFIHRDLESRGPVPSTTRENPGTFFGLIGAGTESTRTGKPFWQVLADNDVPADIWRMPINYPVEETKGVSFPGMLTPAIDSAYGEATLFSTDAFIGSTIDSEKVVNLTELLGTIETEISGPPGLSAPLTMYLDREAEAVVLDTGLERLILQPGDWSDWTTLSFKVDMFSSLSGVVRFYLRQIEPELVLYASPVNVDPASPAMPVSEPSSAAADLAEAIGTYYTQGMAEDVSSFKALMIEPEEFWQQSMLVYEERREMLDYALDRYIAKPEGGVLFFYFSTVDLMSHMLWRFSDDQHPNFAADYADELNEDLTGREGSLWRQVIDDIYLRVDPALGRIREQLDADGEPWELILLSDHGFAPYYRKVNLNRWLLEEGYLVLHERPLDEDGNPTPEPDTIRIFTGAVDWSKTRAYAMGFNGLYLNLEGRERDNHLTKDEKEPGIVKPADADALIAEIEAKLEAWVDPETGENVVLNAVRSDEAYVSTERLAEAPDLLVGYNLGYEHSDESTIGEIKPELIQPNLGGSFNGSHLIDPSLVQGILLSTLPVREGQHGLVDLTVEILARYGIEPIEGMIGERVLE